MHAPSNTPVAAPVAALQKEMTEAARAAYAVKWLRSLVAAALQSPGPGMQLVEGCSSDELQALDTVLCNAQAADT